MIRRPGGSWRQIGETPISVGDVLDGRHGTLMNVGFARMAIGNADLTFPYDPVLVPTKAPRGTVGRFEIGENLEAIYVTYPPYREVISESPQ